MNLKGNSGNDSFSSSEYHYHLRNNNNKDEFSYENEFIYNNNFYDEFENKQNYLRHEMQYKIFANNIRKEMLDSFFVGIRKPELSEVDDFMNYKKYFFRDNNNRYISDLINSKISDHINAKNPQNNNNKNDSPEANILNRSNSNNVDALVSSGGTTGKANNELSQLDAWKLYEDEIKLLIASLLKNEDNFSKYQQSVELSAKLNKLNLIQAEFIEENNIHELKIPKRNLLEFKFDSHYNRTKRLIAKPLDSMFKPYYSNGQVTLRENNIEKEVNNLEDKGLNFFYNNYSFDKLGKLTFINYKDYHKEIINNNNSQNNNDMKSLADKSFIKEYNSNYVNDNINNNGPKNSGLGKRKSTKADLFKERLSQLENRKSLRNSNVRDLYPLKNSRNVTIDNNQVRNKKEKEKKFFNEFGIISFDIRYNFKIDFFVDTLRENLENEDQINFIKLIDYNNNNKINFFEKIQFGKISDEAEDIIFNDYRLEIPIDIKSIEKRAEILVDSRIKPINNTLKRLFKLVLFVKKYIEKKRGIKKVEDTHRIMKNRKTGLLTHNVLKSLNNSIIQENNEESAESDFRLTSESKLIYINDSNNQINLLQNYENSGYLESKENGEKENISFGNEKKQSASTNNHGNSGNRIKNYLASSNTQLTREPNLTEDQILELKNKMKMHFKNNKKTKAPFPLPKTSKDFAKEIKLFENKNDVFSIKNIDENNPNHNFLESKNSDNFNHNKNNFVIVEKNKISLNKKGYDKSSNNLPYAELDTQKNELDLNANTMMFDLNLTHKKFLPREINIQALKSYIQEELNKNKTKI